MKVCSSGPRSLLLALLLSFAFGVAPGLLSQTVTGSIYGTVTDATGAAVPGATVTITEVETSQISTTTSNGTGAYVFPVVKPGTYNVTATMSGFETMTQKGLSVAANQNVNASFAMKVGVVNTEVSVSATAALIDTRESQLAETIDQKRIVDLPLSQRNAYGLVTLMPGITKYSEGAQIGDNGGTQFSTDGIRPNFNSFYLDGAYNTSFFRGGGNIVPNPDALQQFRVITSNFDAEFGRYPGAVVNTITRSGTNQYHGVLFDYFRNAVLNGRNYFQQKGTPNSQYIYNVFGGGVGGPVVKDKLFAFLSYQGTRWHQQAVVNPTALVVPTDAERNGDFSASTKKPKTTICPAYQCPLDTATQNILKAVPHADPALTDSAGAHPDQQVKSSPTIADQGVARIDYQLNSAHRLSLTYFNSQGTGYNWAAGGNKIFDYSGNTTYAGQSNYVLADTWIISPHVVNTATAFYTLNKTVQGNAVNGYFFSDLGMTIANGGPVISQPQATVTGYFLAGVGGSGPNTQAQMATGLEDTANWTVGNHTIKFGGSMIFNKYQETADFLSSSKETFNGSITGNALADFIAGRAQSFLQNSGALHRLHALDPSLFLQDDWRLTRRFTADLGVRWEVYYPFSGQGDFATFIAGKQSTRFPTAPSGMLFEGDPGVPPGVLHVTYNKFAPRLGFAWDVFGTGKTSLRGAYGIFYSFSQETFVGNLEQQPFTMAVTLNNTTNFVNPYQGQAAWPNGSPFPYKVNLQNPVFNTHAQLSGMTPYNAKIPYVEQYNLTLEQQWGTNWSTRMSYVGNVGRDFYVARDQNAPLYNSTATVANEPQRRPYYDIGYTSSIGLLEPSAGSSYNSMQLALVGKVGNNLSVQAFYVWSKAMDILSADPGSATGYTLADQYNPALDWGLSNLDVPQSFVTSFLYQFPEMHRWGAFGKEVVNGWQLNGIVSLQKGNPFNILSNKDSNLDALTAGDRPNVVGNPLLSSGRSKKAQIEEYFNTDAYAQVPAGTPYGNSPRNPLIGPGTENVDVSAFKRFYLREGTDLLFRTEAFNLFNHTNLDNPNGTLTAGAFGKITSAGPPRIFQFALKLDF